MSTVTNSIFSPELAARFDKLVTIYPVKRSALIPMLLYAQDEVGYVSEAVIQEIAQRLERCFEKPFEVEDMTLQGYASVGIALYPEDGRTRDGLLHTADTAMYSLKYSRRRAISIASGTYR